MSPLEAAAEILRNLPAGFRARLDEEDTVSAVVSALLSDEEAMVEVVGTALYDAGDCQDGDGWCDCREMAFIDAAVAVRSLRAHLLTGTA